MPRIGIYVTSLDTCPRRPNSKTGCGSLRGPNGRAGQCRAVRILGRGRGAAMPRQGATNVSGMFDLRLFGCWDLRVGERTIKLGGREQRLLALLALRGRRPRSYVAGTLGPPSPEPRAQNSLRAAVLRSRKAAPGLL